MSAVEAPQRPEPTCGPIRIVRLNRPDELNATDHELHRALADLHVVLGLVAADGEVLERALEVARRIAKLPQRTVEDTKRVMNLHLERVVLATIDFALTAEDRSFTSPEVRANIDRLLKRDRESS